jgi:hypothetical protein
MGNAALTASNVQRERLSAVVPSEFAINRDPERCVSSSGAG